MKDKMLDLDMERFLNQDWQWECEDCGSLVEYCICLLHKEILKALAPYCSACQKELETNKVQNNHTHYIKSIFYDYSDFIKIEKVELNLQEFNLE